MAFVLLRVTLAVVTRVLRFIVKHIQRQTLRCTLQFRIEPYETIYLIERAVTNTTETATVRREERLDRHKRQTLSLPTAISFFTLSLPIYFNRILLVRWALRLCRLRLEEVSLSCWRQLMPSLSLHSFLLFRTTFLVLALFISINKTDHNSNKSPTRCNNFPVHYPDVYLQLNMFRAFSRPSSGAQWLQWQPLILPSYRGDSRAVFVVGPVNRPDHGRENARNMLSCKETSG